MGNLKRVLIIGVCCAPVDLPGQGGARQADAAAQVGEGPHIRFSAQALGEGPGEAVVRAPVDLPGRGGARQADAAAQVGDCLLYTSPSPRD